MHLRSNLLLEPLGIQLMIIFNHWFPVELCNRIAWSFKAYQYLSPTSGGYGGIHLGAAKTEHQDIFLTFQVILNTSQTGDRCFPVHRLLACTLPVWSSLHLYVTVRRTAVMLIPPKRKLRIKESELVRVCLFWAEICLLKTSLSSVLLLRRCLLGCLVHSTALQTFQSKYSVSA